VDITFPGGADFDNVRLLLERVTAAVRSLGETHEIGMILPVTTRAPPRTLRVRRGATPRQASVAQVGAWFAFGTSRMPARAFFEVNDSMREAITHDLLARFLDEVRDGTAPPNRGALNLSMAYRYKAAVIGRWEAGGGDMTVAPLSAVHLARKALLGYPARIGTMTGQTLTALRSAKPITRRAPGATTP